jgi:uncharacterized protein (DUF1015 family)
MFTPFRGSYFADNVAASTSPPYDMIDDVDRFRESSPHNIARLLLPRSHEEASRLLSRWRGTGIVRTDATPRFYLYTMQFRATNGNIREARGVVGAMQIEEFGPRVLAHEEIMGDTGTDRRQLLEATRANLDLIIALSSSRALAGLLEPVGTPRWVVETEGVRHAVYDLHDSNIGAAIDAHPLAIADGHHRYTAALESHASRGLPGPWDSIMAFVAPAVGSGLDILPIHRFFPTLSWNPPEDHFGIRPGPTTPPTEPGTITVVLQSGSWLLTPRVEALRKLPLPWQRASTAVTRELLLPSLGVHESDADFHGDPARLLDRLANHPGGAVMLMAAVPDDAVAAAADDRLRFPRKTTLFMPKPLAGLIFRCFEDQAPA